MYKNLTTQPLLLRVLRSFLEIHIFGVKFKAHAHSATQQFSRKGIYQDDR